MTHPVQLALASARPTLTQSMEQLQVAVCARKTCRGVGAIFAKTDSGIYSNPTPTDANLVTAIHAEPLQ